MMGWVIDRDQLIEDAVKAKLLDKVQQEYQEIRWPLSAKREAALLQAIASGLFMNAARRCGDVVLYKALPLRYPTLSASSATMSASDDTSTSSELSMLHVHPSSALALVGAGGTGSVPGSMGEYVVYQSLQVAGKLCMRNVQAVSAATLRELRTQWRPQHPLVLSNRQLPSVTSSSPTTVVPTAISESNKRKRDDENFVANSGTVPPINKPTEVTDVATNLDAARARYLARKK
jgi:hypothetical protein